MKKKYAFILMGNDYDVEIHRAVFETDKMITYIRTVGSMEQAFQTLEELETEGVGAVELCGAFGPENAEKMIEKTGNRIAVGYVTHNPEQDRLFDSFFGAE